MISKTNIIILLIIVTYTANACGYYKKRIMQTGINEISFGTGGGFTGKIYTYRLTSKGCFFNDTALLFKIKPKETFKYFINAQKLLHVETESPSNIYIFLNIKTTDSIKRFIWNNLDKSTNQDVHHLYNSLNKKIKSHEYKY